MDGWVGGWVDGWTDGWMTEQDALNEILKAETHVQLHFLVLI